MGELNDEFIEKSVTKANLLTSSMSGTIDDFRSFFKTNKQIIEFNLEETTEKSLSLVNPTFVHNNIVIEHEFTSDIKVIGFPNEFSQVILNILTNAKDAFEGKEIVTPKVSLIISENKKFGIVTIKDNAGGINEQIISKIFDPYFTTKEEGKGTGIGLYMSKIIIEDNMNGKLYVNNIKEGSEFIVMVPLLKKTII
jgi:signal transduction histidine kinase